MIEKVCLQSCAIYIHISTCAGTQYIDETIANGIAK